MRVVKVKPGGKTRCTYVGREFAGYPRSVFANPHHVGRCPCGQSHERGEAVQLYRDWLHRRIVEGSREIIDALLALPEDAALGCWCDNIKNPYEGKLICHAQVVARAARWLKGSPCPLCLDTGTRWVWDQTGECPAFCVCIEGKNEEERQLASYGRLP